MQKPTSVQAVGKVQTPADLAERLRLLRRQGRYSLADVARATGISTSFLSVLEAGTTDISLGRLLKLVAFYGIRIGDLIPEPDRVDPVVTRSSDGRAVFSGPDVDASLLAPYDTGHRMMCFSTTLPKKSSIVTYEAHEGEEFVYVVSGEVKLSLEGEQPVVLTKGDSAHFGAYRPHSLSGKAEIIIVASPPDLYLHEAPVPED